MQKHLGISGLRRLARGEAAGTRLGPGHGAPGRWQEGVGVQCDERFEHRRPSPQPGEMWPAADPLTAISIRWPKPVLATVLFQLVSGTKSVVGIFCVLSCFSSLRSSTTLQMLQTKSGALLSFPLHLLPDGSAGFRVGKITLNSIDFMPRPCFLKREVQVQLRERLKSQQNNTWDC